jgi:TolA-binding protein
MMSVSVKARMAFALFPSLFLAAILCAFPKAPPAQAQTKPARSTPSLGGQLSSLYKKVGAHFWRGENLLSSQTSSRAERNALLAKPLPESNLAYREYSQCADSAEAFLKLADENKITNWMLDPVLYFGGLAHFTLGSYSRAGELLGRLSPEYRREVYINDRFAPDPEFSVPTQPGVSKLLFYTFLQSLPAKPADASAALQQVAAEGLKTLSLQREYANSLANRKNVQSRRVFDERIFGGQPDQIRAAALPPTLQLVESAWDALLPAATAKNAVALRDYLRGLRGENILAGSTPDAPLAELAARKLPAVDARVVQIYFAQAQSLLKANNFDDARKKYRQIIAEYPDTTSAQKAEHQFPAVTHLAVAFYKTEGQKHFQTVNQVGQPQTKSREYFEKLLKEDPNSDFALYYHSRALATENKIGQALKELQSFDKKHAQSPLRASALFLHGFLLASQKPPNYKQALALMDEVAKTYPQSEEAPEALFYGATYLAWQSRFGEAIARLQQLEKYPDSIRHKWAKSFSAYLQEKQKTGASWP